jgi:hypothetical protein
MPIYRSPTTFVRAEFGTCGTSGAFGYEIAALESELRGSVRLERSATPASRSSGHGGPGSRGRWGRVLKSGL